jgi:drug/metabolite transporter (DMT)-like permease
VALAAGRQSLALFALLAIVWGIPYALIKVAVRDMPVEDVVFGRLLIGAVALLPLAIHRGAFAGLRERWRWIVPLAAVQMAGPFTLITLGERWVSSSLAGVLVASNPLWIALLALAFDHSERASGRNLVGLLAGIVGVGLLLGVDLGGGQPLLGGALITLAALGYACGGLLTKHRFAGTQPLGLSVACMSVSAAMLAIPAAFALPDHVPTTSAVVSVAVLGLFCTGIAFILFYALLAQVGAARSSLVAYIAPIVAVLVGVGFLGDSLGAASIVGIVVILAGSRLAARR